jgi:hypothetical protein
MSDISKKLRYSSGRRYQGGIEMQPTTIKDHRSLILMIGEVCAQLRGESVSEYEARGYSKNVVSMLTGIAAAESGMWQRRQIGGGPARGLWQMEPGMTGAQDIFASWLFYRPQIFLRVTKIWFNVGIRVPFVPEEEVLAEHLEFDDPFACALARIKLLRDPNPIPWGPERQARYWRRVYMTVLGAQTEEHYMEMWSACECERLLRETGYWRT